MRSYQQQADHIYNSLLEMENNAAPEQLFLCSYLLGHVSLISSEQGNTASDFTDRVQHSLERAFKVDKLTSEDIRDIENLWQQLNGVS